MSERMRGERLQIMLSPEELATLDDFRFKHRMPSRASAIREILRRGLASPEKLSASGSQSSDFGVLQRRRSARKEQK
jgi:metal-responsive CopG/Arc/MetJ family transcriptional regulator